MEIVNLINEIENFPPSPGRLEKWNPRPLSGITDCVVHHTAGPEDADPFDVHESQRNRNFASPGSPPALVPRVTYHYLIDVAGVVYKCNKAEWVTWHCPGKNRSGLSICVIGNRSLVAIPQSQWDSLIDLCAEVKPAFSIAVERFSFHRNHFNTQCPGWKMNLTMLRDQLRGR